MTHPPNDLAKMLGDLRSALLGIHSSLDMITANMLETQTCDHSMVALSGYVGPCILRRDHDGPVHRDRREQEWIISQPDEEPIGVPTGWMPCTTEYFRDLSARGVQEPQCGNLSRLPAGNVQGVDHLHPREIDSARSYRTSDGTWASKTSEDALTREQEWENSEIQAWRRQYGNQR